MLPVSFNRTGVGAGLMLQLERTPGAGSSVAPDVEGKDQHSSSMLSLAAETIARLAKSGMRGVDSSALASASKKISWPCADGSDSIDSAMAEVLKHQFLGSSADMRSARTTIKSHYAKVKTQNKKRLEQIHKRIEARRKAAKWGVLGKIFKVIGAALSAVSSIFTGPAGMAGAALLVASLVVSMTVKGDTGKWLSLGLSLAGAAFTMGSSIVGQAVKEGAMRVAQKAIEVSSKCAEIAGYGCGVGGGAKQKDAMEAKAALVEIKALTSKLLTDADQEQDEMEAILEADSRCYDLVMKIFETNNAAYSAACRV